MIEGQKMLVVSAHAADYVWRAGGTIAKYIARGAEVHVMVLSFGVRGESNDLWDQEGMDEAKVKSTRRGETEAAAAKLGVKNIEFWDMQDYPMTFTAAEEERLVRKIRQVKPDIILTHDKYDVLNPDHNQVNDFVFRCSVMSNSNGVKLEGTQTTKQMRLYGFEPHQTELSNYTPGSLIDITESYGKKIAAMKCFKAQGHLIEYYTQRAFLRGNHLRRISGEKNYKYGESFANFFPFAGSELL